MLSAERKEGSLMHWPGKSEVIAVDVIEEHSGDAIHVIAAIAMAEVKSSTGKESMLKSSVEIGRRRRV